jgi:hypothetical protein
MSEVPYGRYEEAYKAIHSALMDLTCPPPGRKLTKLGFAWNVDGTLASLRAYDGADLLFTLSFTWNTDGTLREAART